MASHNRNFKIAFDVPEEELEDNLDYIELFWCAVRAMRFSYDITLEPEISELLSNGTWTGQIGLLNRSEVDYTPGPFIVTDERWEAVAFNYPISVDDTTFVTRKPRYIPEIMTIFRTLSLSVWLSLLASFILVMLVCLVTLKYRCTVEDVVFHVLAVGLNQQGNIMPQKTGEYLLLCTWMVAMALFTFCFKSVLLSFLSFPPLVGVRTIPELAAAIRAGTHSAMAMGDNFFPRYLQGSPIEDIRLIGENILQNPPGFVHDLFNGSLKDSNVVLVNPRSYVSFAEGKLYVSKDSMGTYFQATAVSKDFCCKDELDTIIHRFLAAGIDQKINHFIDFKEAFWIFSELTDDDKERKITMTDISGAFILLIAGYCLSVCLLLIELWIKNRETYHASTRNKLLRVLYPKGQDSFLSL